MSDLEDDFPPVMEMPDLLERNFKHCLDVLCQAMG